MYESILDIEPKVETRENSVTMYLKLPKNSNPYR
jgi:hypothetical protein